MREKCLRVNKVNQPSHLPFICHQAGTLSQLAKIDSIMMMSMEQKEREKREVDLNMEKLGRRRGIFFSSSPIIIITENDDDNLPMAH